MLPRVCAGAPFNNYTLDDEKKGKKDNVMLFYEPDYTNESGSKGIVCWNFEGKRKVVEGQTMEIHHITGVRALFWNNPRNANKNN